MVVLQVPGYLGTVAMERLTVALLKALNLDKNGDGKVSKAEVFAALGSLAPEFFAINDVIDETRDLSQAEFQHLIDVAVDNMPDYPNVRQEVETLLKSILEWVGATAKAILAWKQVSFTAPAAEPANKVNPVTDATKAKPAGK